MTPAPPEPRYHVRRSSVLTDQYPGLVFVRLTCLSPALWAQLEPELKRLGLRAH